MLHIKLVFVLGIVSLLWDCAELAPPPNNRSNSVDPLLMGGTEVIGDDDDDDDSNECLIEICDGLDNDCDGLPDEDLICACSEDTSCYGGPPDTQEIGECKNGARLCGSDGEIWGECEDWIAPLMESCDELDNDCDGQVDEGMLNACGLCGEVPQEVCDELDNDCDGQVDEDMLNACGLCGEVPQEVCDELDNDCDGQADEGMLNACGSCGAVPVEVCDEIDNDCDGSVDEGGLNACGSCEAVPVEVCDSVDNDCDGTVDEGVRNACGTCGNVPVEVCDSVDNDCDGTVDERVRNACGTCGNAPEEVCDLVDNDCDGTVDEQGCVITNINIRGDCVTAECPNRAPYPIACDINFQGNDPRGCVAYRPGESSVYFQEGNQCGVGRVVGTMTCSTIQGGRLNANNCPINKEETYYPRQSRNCPDTD